jgi:hypothetical protein
LGLLLGFDPEDVQIEKAVAGDDAAEKGLPGDDNAAGRTQLRRVDQRFVDGNRERRQITAARGLEQGTVETALDLDNVRPILAGGACQGISGAFR